jgi:hypothetical protein
MDAVPFGGSSKIVLIQGSYTYSMTKFQDFSRIFQVTFFDFSRTIFDTELDTILK